VFSLPVDMVKTRLQVSSKNADGKVLYTGSLDCFSKTIKNDGFFSLWKGFMPYFLKIGPHTVLT
jgi:solute carrier family 25 (mitochondrial oxoglutarate transporter), member 11